MMKCVRGSVTLAFMLWIAVCVPTVHAQHFSFMTYNCENAFDTLSTDHHNDQEFLPDGPQHWTRWRFSQKMNRIAQVFLAADTLHPLDMAVLQEVESDTVLTWLTHRTPLASVGYDYIMTDSRDPRGINVALVYQPFTFRPIATEFISLSNRFLQKHNFTPTRDILHVSGRLTTGDTLDVFAVHLPSRLGQREATQKRAELQCLLFSAIDSMQTIRTSPHILVAGDFNESPSRKMARRTPRIHNLMLGRKGGSYKYHGRWEWIDQVWVSDSLYDALTDIRALTLPFLLEEDEGWGGVKPFRTFYGPAYHRGYSDHLPVVVTFRLR